MTKTNLSRTSIAAMSAENADYMDVNMVALGDLR